LPPAAPTIGAFARPRRTIFSAAQNYHCRRCFVTIRAEFSINSRTIQGITLTTTRVGLLDRYFYFFMSLLIAAVVVYGFSQTINDNLFHPAIPRPFILSVHAAVFSTWIVFFIFQSALVRTHHVPLHRLTGWFGVALGATMAILGFSTAIAMMRFDTAQLHETDSAAFLIIPFFDITCFTVCFALAIYWRKQKEFHRRLILIASCALTAAAFGRFPPQILPHTIFYVGVDTLILLGVARDLIVNRRIDPVYLYALPIFILGQTIATYTYLHASPYWLKIAHAILG
jgi:hypothetical protein